MSLLFFDDRTPFAAGRAEFVDLPASQQGGTAKIYVRIEPESFGSPIDAELDTGATWSVLNAEVAEALDLLGGSGEPLKISTRLGEYPGRLERIRVDILADEGASLTVDATVWVSQDWPGGTFVGYRGLLERIRFALDPSDNSFYFGSF